ncbi:MAG TPA: hypothetical protein VEK15_28105 [Vicinamibacteria bacterium]|nr:hypothetical protein [Vicinamibacteria bacterium]
MSLVLALVAGLSAGDIRLLGQSDDVRYLPLLENACRPKLAGPITPDVEEEQVACLDAIRRLDPEKAASYAEAVLDSVPDSCPPFWSALRVLASAGDLSTIRRGLTSYFEEPTEWRTVLAEASHRDVRLRDFSPWAPDGREDSERLLRSRLEQNLGRPPPEPTTGVAPALEAPNDVGLREQILAVDADARYRAIRVLAARDDDALVGLPIDGQALDRLYPYLVGSRHPSLRRQIPRTERARGEALAALLLSNVATEEEKRSAVASMTDAWPRALETNGVYEVMASLVEASRVLDRAGVGALSIIPLPEARLRLEALATPEAIEGLMRRADRGLAVPVLSDLRRLGSPPVRYAAEKALLTLGAPGSTTFLKSRTELGDLLPVVMKAPLEGETLRELISPVVSTRSPSPEALAALFQLHARHPSVVLSYLGEEPGPLAERFHFVLSLSGEPRRLPILVDLAVNESAPASREAAFTGLAEAELGSFEKRLHRLAGHPDRSVRFRAAAALAPSGEPWIVRLLVAELSESERAEVERARRALQRITPERARRVLEEMIWDGTATAFAVNAFISLSPEAIREDRALQRRIWELVEEGVAHGTPLSLIAASRLSHPRALRAVRTYIERR